MNDISSSYGRDLDLNLLRVFAVVAEESNITRAAARLYVTQPAISAAIRRLTEFVGVDLIVRQGRGIALTKRGEELVAAARSHLQPLVAATMAVPTFDPKTSTATFRIGLGDGLEMTIFPKLLERLRTEGPRLQLVVVPAQFRILESLLLSNKADLVLSVADDLPRSIVRETLVFGRGSRHGFCCLYDPRFAKLPKTLTEREYFAREHVVVSYAGDDRGIIEDELGKTRRARVVVPNFGLVADVLDGSALLATVPVPLARHLVKTRPHLRHTRLPFELPLDDTNLDLLWPRIANDDPLGLFMRALVKRVVADVVTELRARSRAK